MTFDSFVSRKKTVLKKTTLPTIEDFAKTIVEEVKEIAEINECGLEKGLEIYLKDSCAGKATIKRVKEILEV